jgi:hypothetical protein
MPIPFDSTAAGRSEDSRRGDAPGDTQQQTLQDGFRQHERWAFRGAESEVDAETLLTMDSIPATAAKATKESRRW